MSQLLSFDATNKLTLQYLNDLTLVQDANVNGTCQNLKTILTNKPYIQYIQISSDFFEVADSQIDSENQIKHLIEIDANSLLIFVDIYNKPDMITVYENSNKYWIDNSNNVVQNMFENIQKNKYKFIAKQISIFIPNFTNTTSIIACETDNGTISISSNAIVNCENNFTIDEKNVIDKFNIFNIDDLIQHNEINNDDKLKCLKCFDQVCERYQTMGIEPFNGHIIIKFDNLAINIRILPDRTIKYCKI